jgi:hypothetical protein
MELKPPGPRGDGQAQRIIFDAAQGWGFPGRHQPAFSWVATSDLCPGLTRRGFFFSATSTATTPAPDHWNISTLRQIGKLSV